MSATKVVSFALGKGYNLVYKNVFKNPTPQLLAKFITETQSEAASLYADVSAYGGSAGSAAATVRAAEIRPALRGNTVDQLDDISYTPLGDVLLAGCTSF